MAGSVTIAYQPTVSSVRVSGRGDSPSVSFTITNYAQSSPITSVKIHASSYSGYYGVTLDVTPSSQGIVTGYFSHLRHNETYYFYGEVTNSTGTVRTNNSQYYVVGGSAPKIKYVIATPSSYGCLLTPIVEYDDGDSYGSVSIEYGTTTDYGYTSTSYNLSNLNTWYAIYYYKMTIRSSRSYYGTYTGSFTTTIPRYTDHILLGSSVTVNDTTINITAQADNSAFFYTIDGGANWYGPSGNSRSFTNLTPGQTYTVGIQVAQGYRFAVEYYRVTIPDVNVIGDSKRYFYQEGYWDDTNIHSVYIPFTNNYLINPYTIYR